MGDYVYVKMPREDWDDWCNDADCTNKAFNAELVEPGTCGRCKRPLVMRPVCENATPFTDDDCPAELVDVSVPECFARWRELVKNAPVSFSGQVVCNKYTSAPELDPYLEAAKAVLHAVATAPLVALQATGCDSVIVRGLTEAEAKRVANDPEAEL